MSEQAVLWAFGVLIVALFGLIGIIYRNIIGRLNRLDTGALGQFVAKDVEREKQWMFWRVEVDKRLDSHASSIRSIETRIARAQINGDKH